MVPDVDAAGAALADANAPINERFRAMFALTSVFSAPVSFEADPEDAQEEEDDGLIPGISAQAYRAAEEDEAAKQARRVAARLHLEAALRSRDRSLEPQEGALLRHEAAYALGQCGDVAATPVLIEILADADEDPMVRHECAEALGALGEGIGEQGVSALVEFEKCDVQEVAETCSVSLARLAWARENPQHPQASGGRAAAVAGAGGYASVDPAPPAEGLSVSELRKILLNPKKSVFKRYSAMFALRDVGTGEAVEALVAALGDQTSALFRHEAAYVLGQLAQDGENGTATAALAKVLADTNENPMVRHEAAEAIGAIASDQSAAVLQQYTKDHHAVVRESVLVGMDIVEFFTHEDSTDAPKANEVKQTQERKA